MKRLIVLCMLLGILLSCSQKKESNSKEFHATEESTPVLTVDAFDVDAGNYVDQEVRLTGIVDHVCKHSGKKLKLVTDGGSVHVDSETRFDDGLVGNQIEITGIVRALRIDESYCLKMEEDNIQNHKDGAMDDDQFKNKQAQLQHYRDSMNVAGVDYLAYYSLEFVSLEEGDSE